MRPKVCTLKYSVLLLGLALTLCSCQPRNTSTKTTSLTSQTPVSSQSPKQTEENTEQSRVLEDTPALAKISGTRIPLSFDKLFDGLEPNDYDLKDEVGLAKIIPLSAGEFIVGIGDKVQRLDAKGKIRWKYRPSFHVFDCAYIKATNLVYGTAGDNVMFILNATTGKELYRKDRNGSFAYGVAIPFGKDKCLITDNEEGYREKLAGSSADFVITDGVTAWQGTTPRWRAEIPPNAELQIVGEKVFAVTKTNKNIYVKEILPEPVRNKK